MFFLVSFASAQTKLNSDSGVADLNQKGDVCLTIPNSKLAKGDVVYLVLPGKPQSIRAASVRNKLTRSCSDNSDAAAETDSFYLLKLSSGKLKTGDAAIVLANVKKPENVVGGTAAIDVNNDGKKDFFRACTSREGLWLSIWSGKPLRGKRLWNRYYYLGYDVVPNCKESDFKD